MLLLAVLMLGALAMQLATPQIVRLFLDGAREGSPVADLTRLALIFLAVVISGQLVNSLGRYAGEDVGWTATNALRTDLVKHCLRLDMSFHKQHAPGELIERIDGDVNLLSNFFSQFIIGIISNLLLLCGVLVMLYREDWRIGLALTFFSVLALIVLNFTRGLAVKHLSRVRETSGKFYGFVGEHLAGTEDIRASGGAAYVMQRLYRFLRDWLKQQISAYKRHALMRTSAFFTFVLGNSIALGLGAWLFMRGKITLGTVYLILHYTELLSNPIQEIRNQLQDLQRATASIARVEDLFATIPLVQDGPGVELPQGPLALAFEDVHFAYEDGELVLQGISFGLQPGQVMGLLGRTGSGKTTIGRLIARFYDPDSGSVILGGIRASEATLSQLRRKVGVVTQDVQLFHATVRDNLTFFRKDVSDLQILSVLDELSLSKWLSSMPQGLDTILGSGGGSLSAGEAQLLALARCFLADPSLIVLDEASSRLDPATEQLIEAALDKLLKGRTAVVIAHRLETVNRADRIVILDRGRVLEQGDRSTLANDANSRFHQLLQTGIKEVLA